MKKLFLFLSLILLVAGASCQQQSDASQDEKVVEVIPVDDFAKGITVDEVQLVDVRTPEEVDQGTIAGAMHLDFYAEDFQEQLEEKLDKDKPVYLFCRSGNRSNKAANMMAEMGFTKVYDLDGGWIAWSEQ